MVRLDYINLVSDAYPSAIDFTENVDLIICRNVLSSFTTETAHHVVSRLYTALAPGGWLLIGQAEAFPNLHPGLIPPDASVAGVYRKSGHTWADDVPQLPNQAAQPTPHIWAELEDLPEAAFLPEIPEAAECYRRGQQMADQMQWEAAHEWLECAISQNPLLLEAHYADALVYLQEGNDSAAIRALHHTLYIDPDFILAYFSLGLVYWRQRRFQKAAAIWQVTEELLAEHPSDEPLRCGDGILPCHLRSMLTTYLEKVS
jgi:chemotaxis protein methyltransferase CheR